MTLYSRAFPYQKNVKDKTMPVVKLVVNDRLKMWKKTTYLLFLW